jgi:DNA-binding MltR family transcriptional regulator
MGTSLSKYSLDYKHPLYQIKYIIELIEFFKPNNYNLHKFVNLLKKPKTVKIIQEPFYFTLIHYLIFSSIWLEYDKIQQLWYALSWLRIIRDDDTCGSVCIAIKRKNTKPLLNRLKTTGNLNVGGARLKRTNSISMIKNIDYKDITQGRYSINNENNEYYINFENIIDDITSFNFIIYVGQLTALELLEKIYEKMDRINVHRDFIKSYAFLKDQLEKYFN